MVTDSEARTRAVLAVAALFDAGFDHHTTNLGKAVKTILTIERSGFSIVDDPDRRGKISAADFIALIEKELEALRQELSVKTAAD